MMDSLETQTLNYRDGQVIFSEYEKGDKFYVIQSGSVELLKMAGNSLKTIDILNASDMFGEMAILEDSPRSAMAVAVGATTLVTFDRGNFDQLVLTNPVVAFKLLKSFVSRIYSAKRRFTILTLDDPNARVANVFIMLSDEGKGVVQKDTNRREFDLSMENLSRLSGLTPEQSRESVMYYNKLGYLQQIKHFIVIKDINNFVRIVNAARVKNKT